MELALSGVKTYIAANFEAVRAALAIERAATIPTYKKLEKFNVLAPQYPMIEILPGATKTTARDNIGADVGMETHRITLVYSASGNDTEAIELLLLRYREIIKRIVKLDPSFGGLFYRVALAEADYGVMTRGKEAGKFVKETFQDIIVQSFY